MKGLRITLLLFTAAALAGAPPRLLGAAGSEALLVVVHRGNTVDRLTTYEIAKIFRGETTQWPDGRRIQVIDYTEERPERAAFYRAVYHSDAKRRMARGSPFVFRPLEQRSASLVRRLVAVMPNAIAYLPAAADTAGLKVIARVGESP